MSQEHDVAPKRGFFDEYDEGSKGPPAGDGAQTAEAAMEAWRMATGSVNNLYVRAEEKTRLVEEGEWFLWQGLVAGPSSVDGKDVAEDSAKEEWKLDIILDGRKRILGIPKGNIPDRDRAMEMSKHHLPFDARLVFGHAGRKGGRPPYMLELRRPRVERGQ
jgi:hypothetical protein